MLRFAHRTWNGRPSLLLRRPQSTTTGTPPPPPPSSSTPSGESAISSKLEAAFSPSRLRVQDISGGCGSMYAIEIASTAFRGMSVVRQHRRVNEVLRDEIAKMHGLQLKTMAE